MQNDDHKPGKKQLQQLKTALASSSHDLAEDDGWVERLIHGLEAGINENAEISAVIKTANGEQELNYLPRDKETWLALSRLEFSGGMVERAFKFKDIICRNW